MPKDKDEKKDESNWGDVAEAVNSGQPLPPGEYESPYGKNQIDIGTNEVAGGVDGDDTNTGSSASRPARHGARDN